MSKNFVLDTNVLIHNPGSLYSFADNTVIIPITVIEELDKLKSNSDKKGMHARQVLRELDSMIKKGALKKGARMSNNGILKITFEDPKNPIPDLNLDLNDNKIISVAWNLQKKGQLVFFITKDVNARIKAEALGIKARDYEKQKVEYTSLYSGWKEIRVKKESIDAAYGDGYLELKGYSFQPNEYALLKSDDSSSSSALCRYLSEEDRLAPMKSNYEAMGIHPLNLEQRFSFDLLLNDQIKMVTLVGQAGSGKTLMALACGLVKTIGKSPQYEKLLVARPIIPMGKDIGYLPGTKEQKLNYWMQPIYDNLDFILKSAESSTKHKFDSSGGKNPAVDYLVHSNMLEIEALTYIRGRSIPNQFLIVDEAQNLTPHEIKTIVSRAGKGTKIVLTGDPEQIDNPYLDANSNGLSYCVERLKTQKLFGHILLSKSERSDLATLAVDYL